jgi:hypothetical protein
MTADELTRTVQALADRAEIIDCLTRYARGMDRLDRALARSAYHDDALDDHVGFAGPVDDFLDWAFGYHGTQMRHQHFITNVTIDVAGDVAHTESYYLFVGSYADEQLPLTVTGGRYVDRFERRDGRWAIAARACLVEWRTEATDLLTGPALEFSGLAGTIARDASDASYQRPLTVRSGS